MHRSGAVAAAHPLAARAAREVALRGGTAVDAAIAAQTVIAVAMPHAAGLGGDVLALVGTPDGPVAAVNGTGRAPADWPTLGGPGAGNSVTVPGAVRGWADLHDRHGALPWAEVLEPATRLARDGIVVDDGLAAAVEAHRERIEAVSPGCPLPGLAAGSRWTQPELAALLDDLAARGPAAWYEGPAAAAIARAVAGAGGSLSAADLHDHRSVLGAPVTVAWSGTEVHVQPPSSQGVLLAMALQWLDPRVDGLPADRRDHVLVELTHAVFGHRDDCADRGAALLAEALDVDVDRAAHRPGPRAYLHTAGVATADSDGMVVSSLVSVFDAFGSAVWVPELGVFLNDRAGGFTAGANAPRPAARPVHTLAPLLAALPDGGRLALATPGADGQIQTLLQVLTRLRAGEPLAAALAAPRWRSEDGVLLVEDGHPLAGALRERGHRVVPAPAGSAVFGSVVAAGLEPEPFAAADPRRESVSLTWCP